MLIPCSLSYLIYYTNNTLYTPTPQTIDASLNERTAHTRIPFPLSAEQTLRISIVYGDGLFETDKVNVMWDGGGEEESVEYSDEEEGGEGEGEDEKDEEEGGAKTRGGKRGGLSWGVVIGAAVVTGVMVAVGICVSICVWRWRRGKKPSNEGEMNEVTDSLLPDEEEEGRKEKEEKSGVSSDFQELVPD